MSQINKIVVLGGDERQYYMTLQLKQLDYPIAVYGLDMKDKKDSIYEAISMKEALSFGNIVICSVPCSRDNINLYTRCHAPDLTIGALLDGLTGNHILFGGAICPPIKEYCTKNHICYFDFMDMESVAIANAVATAEGSIAEAIIRSPGVLHQSNCVILGFGRCGKILADKLSGLKAHVTITARSEEALCLAQSYGYDTVSMFDMNQCLAKAAYIFNTVPFLVLDSSNLSYVQKNATIIDIASAPGGVNYEYCKQMNINAALCLGLPGKYAPLTSAQILTDALLTAITTYTSS